MKKSHVVNSHQKDINGGQYIPSTPQYDAGYEDGKKAGIERAKSSVREILSRDESDEAIFRSLREYTK